MEQRELGVGLSGRLGAALPSGPQVQNPCLRASWLGQAVCAVALCLAVGFSRTSECFWLNSWLPPEWVKSP